MFDAKFPEVIDSTIIKDFKKCENYFYQRHVLGKKVHFEDKSIHLVAGGAWAKGLEEARKAFYFNGTAPEIAIKIGLDALAEEYDPEREGEKKSKAKLLRMFPHYFNRWPLDTSSGIVPIENGIEWQFKVPIEGFVHPDTGEQLYYAGRSDLIGTMLGGADCFDFSDDAASMPAEAEIWGMDDKTCGTFTKLWNWEYELDLQMIGYMWAARKLGIPVAGWRIRGAGFGKVTPDPLTDLKETQVNYRPAISAKFEQEMRRCITKIIEVYKTGDYSLSLSEGCKMFFSICDYQAECSNSPNVPQYDVIRWNPLEVSE